MATSSAVPVYIPPPSTGHEIGVMFGFLGAMLLSMILYGIAWNIGNKRFAKQEAERVAKMKASGYMDLKAAGGNDMETEYTEKKPEPTELTEGGH